MQRSCCIWECAGVDYLHAIPVQAGTGTVDSDRGPTSQPHIKSLTGLHSQETWVHLF